MITKIWYLSSMSRNPHTRRSFYPWELQSLWLQKECAVPSTDHNLLERWMFGPGTTGTFCLEAGVGTETKDWYADGSGQNPGFPLHKTVRLQNSTCLHIHVLHCTFADLPDLLLSHLPNHLHAFTRYLHDIGAAVTSSFHYMTLPDVACHHIRSHHITRHHLASHHSASLTWHSIALDSITLHCRTLTVCSLQ